MIDNPSTIKQMTENKPSNLNKMGAYFTFYIMKARDKCFRNEITAAGIKFRAL